MNQCSTLPWPLLLLVPAGFSASSLGNYMNIAKTTFIILLFFLYGCSSDGETFTLKGTWRSQECIATDGMDLWTKGIYEFFGDASFAYSRKGYLDSDCIQEASHFVRDYRTLVTLTIGDPPYDGYAIIPVSGRIDYFELETIQLEEGLNGNKVLFNINLTNESIDIETYYYAEGNKACFSNAFLTNDKDLLFSGVADDAINFANCLIRESP